MIQENFNTLLEKARHQSIFVDEGKLENNFLPNELPHREKELLLLAQLFLPILSLQNSISKNILVIGDSGIGKTATVKLFGKRLKEAAEKRGISLNFVIVNCRREKTSYNILLRIVKTMDKKFPRRGYSPSDLLDILEDFVKIKNVYLLLVLDEIDYLIKNDTDLVYSLVRLNDDSNNIPQRFSIIGIVKNLSCINDLDSGTLSTIQKNIIRFANYSRDQIFDIIKYRAGISLKKDVVSDDLINLVSDTTFIKGDIRYGVNLLWKAGKVAESKNLSKITEECIELANRDLFPIQNHNILAEMNTQKLVFLFNIVNYLRKSKKSLIPLIETLKPYYTTCKNIGVKPLSNSQLWNYLQEYKNKNFITVEAENKDLKGNKGIIGIPGIPLMPFEQNIKILLASRGVFI